MFNLMRPKNVGGIIPSFHHADSQDEAERRIAAWQADRNERQKGIDWQFSTGDARIKPKRLYPKIKLR